MKHKPGPLSFLLDLLSGRINNRVIELTQKVRILFMKHEEVKTRLQALSTKIKADQAAIQSGIEDLKSKVNNGDEIDAEADFDALDAAVEGLSTTADSFHATATEVAQSPAPETGTAGGGSPASGTGPTSGGVAGDISGIDAGTQQGSTAGMGADAERAGQTQVGDAGTQSGAPSGGTGNTPGSQG
jgi:hypothetical protein